MFSIKNSDLINGTFRAAQNCKAQVVRLIDQTSEEEQVKQAVTQAIINGKDLPKETLKKEFLMKFKHKQLLLCKNVSILEPYSFPEMEQMMDNDQTVLSFLLKQQNRTLTTDNPLLFDFKAPLELEMVLLKDTVL